MAENYYIGDPGYTGQAAVDVYATPFTAPVVSAADIAAANAFSGISTAYGPAPTPYVAPTYNPSDYGVPGMYGDMPAPPNTQFGLSGTQPQSYTTPYTQAFTGQIGGMISGAMNPYKANFNAPKVGEDIYKYVDNAWSGAFKSLQNAVGLGNTMAGMTAGKGAGASASTIAGATIPQASAPASTPTAPVTTPVQPAIPSPAQGMTGIQKATYDLDTAYQLVMGGNAPDANTLALFKQFDTMRPSDVRAKANSMNDPKLIVLADYYVRNASPQKGLWTAPNPLMGDTMSKVPVIGQAKMNTLPVDIQNYFYLNYAAQNGFKNLTQFALNSEKLGGDPDKMFVLIPEPMLKQIQDKKYGTLEVQYGVPQKYDASPFIKINWYPNMTWGEFSAMMDSHGYYTGKGSYAGELFGYLRDTSPSTEAGFDNPMVGKEVTIPSATMLLGDKLMTFYNNVLTTDTSMNIKGRQPVSNQGVSGAESITSLEKDSKSGIEYTIEYDSQGNPTGRLAPRTSRIEAETKGASTMVVPMMGVTDRTINNLTTYFGNNPGKYSNTVVQYFTLGGGLSLLVNLFKQKYGYNPTVDSDIFFKFLDTLNLNDLYSQNVGAAAGTTNKRTGIDMPRFREINY